MTGVTYSVDTKEPQVVPTIHVEGKKPSNMGKHKIWALAAVLVAFVVIGGIVATVVVSLHYTQETIRERSLTLEPERGVKVTENVRVDVNKRTEEYAIKENGMKVMHDFKKDLTVYRMPDRQGSHYCVLTWLETDKVQSPEDTFDALNKDVVDENKVQTVLYGNETDTEDTKDKTETIWYEFTKANVQDRGFLSDEMKAICADNDLFWAIKSNTPVEGPETKIRNKRWFVRLRRAWNWARYHCRVRYVYPYGVRVVCSW